VTVNPGWAAAGLAGAAIGLILAAAITAGHEHRKEGK
jgi:hypothetical protein